MKAVTHDAYGGGMYGTEPGQPKKPVKPPASETQSADGPVEATKHTLLPQLVIEILISLANLTFSNYFENLLFLF